MAKNLQLSGLIHSQFGSEAKMAQSMGWSRQRLNKITNGKHVPDLFEVNDMAAALNTSFISMARIFLGTRSTNVDFDPLNFHA